MPLSVLYLHTCFFRSHHGSALSDEEKKFATVTWEIFHILKENFPSKISLRQENLDKCGPIFIQITQSEELRRQLSCILSIKEELRRLTPDEVEDTMHTMDFAEKMSDFRAVNTCLEILYKDHAHYGQYLKYRPQLFRRIADTLD